MTHFSVGEQVIIRYGKHHGQKATIIRSQPGDAYRVKVEDGIVLFYSGKGLEKYNKGFHKEETMVPKKTLEERQTELQSLLANPMGRKELQDLESRYHEVSGRLKPAKTSIITYILVHEREQGLISR